MAEENKDQEKPKKAIKLDLKAPNISIPKLKPNKLATIFGSLIIGIFIGAVVITLFNAGGKISGDAASVSAAEYITGNFLAKQGMSAEVSEVTEEEDFYAVELDIKEGEEQRDKATVYVSRDGTQLIVGQLYDMNEEVTPVTEEATTPPTPDAPKSDKPKVELFVMSYCPYGLQMQKGFLPVMELFGDKIDSSVDWVHYIMHGEKEATENTRQYCIQEEFNDKYLAYANCFVASDDVDKCLEEADIDADKLQTCIDSTTEEFTIQEDLDSGEKFPKYKVTAEASEGYGVRGSPTLVINGKTVSAGRSPEAIKQAVCAAFNDAPEECDTELDAASPSPGIGGGTGEDSDASCG